MAMAICSKGISEEQCVKKNFCAGSAEGVHEKQRYLRFVRPLLYSADLEVANEVVDGLLGCAGRITVVEVGLDCLSLLPLLVGTILQCEHRRSENEFVAVWCGGSFLNAVIHDTRQAIETAAAEPSSCFHIRLME